MLSHLKLPGGYFSARYSPQISRHIGFVGLLSQCITFPLEPLQPGFHPVNPRLNADIFTPRHLTGILHPLFQLTELIFRGLYIRIDLAKSLFQVSPDLPPYVFFFSPSPVEPGALVSLRFRSGFGCLLRLCFSRDCILFRT